MKKNPLYAFWYPVRNRDRDASEISYINMLISVSYLYAALMVGYFIWNLITGTNNGITSMQLISVALMLVSIRYSRTYRIPGTIFLSLCIFYYTVLLLRFADFPYTTMFWSPIIVIAAVYLFGKKQGALWAFLAVACSSVALKWGHLLGLAIFPVDVKTHGYLAMLTQIMCVLAAYGSSILFTNHISHLHMALKEKHSKLEEQLFITQRQNDDIQGLVSVVCHDIANPLSVIMLSTDIALGKCADPFQEKMLQRIAGVSKHIESIIKTVRQYHQIETGKMVMTLESVDLVQVFSGLQEIFRERLLAKTLNLKLDYDPQGTYCVVGNENVLLHNVLSNLVSNAIKFSEMGSEIIIKLEEKSGEIQILVTDFGIGIPPQILHDLFKMDKATSRVGTAGEKGTGFGLPIVKSFVDKFGGSIKVHSLAKTDENPAANSSTTFVVSLKKSTSSESSNVPMTPG